MDYCLNDRNKEKTFTFSFNKFCEHTYTQIKNTIRQIKESDLLCFKNIGITTKKYFIQTTSQLRLQNLELLLQLIEKFKLTLLELLKLSTYKEVSKRNLKSTTPKTKSSRLNDNNESEGSHM